MHILRRLRSALASRRPPGGHLALAFVAVAAAAAMVAASGGTTELLLAGVAALVAALFAAAPGRPALAAVEFQGSASMRLGGDAVAILDAVPDACLIVDEEETIVYANPVALEQLGPVRLGDPVSFKLRTPAVLEAIDLAARTGRPQHIDWSEKVPTERWSEAFVAPLALGADEPSRTRPQEAGRAVIVFIRDLSEQRRLDRMREDFVANASHELRTPLASLAGFIETLQGPARDDPAARERFLAIMQEQAERMRRLIDDLLSLSRIEMRAHLRPRDVVDLGEAVGYAVGALAPLAAGTGVEIALDVPGESIHVRGDRDELVQVFENLVENAIKYGASGERIEVTVGAPADGEIAVAVRDRGEGIAPEHLPRLTERFYRVDDEASRAKRGTGLGLAIVKHILTRHNARLTVESEPGRGATFTARFPQA